MPLTSKGEKIMSHVKEEYGAKKGEQVFYASRNKGNISGVDSESKDANKSPVPNYDPKSKLPIKPGSSTAKHDPFANRSAVTGSNYLGSEKGRREAPKTKPVLPHMKDEDDPNKFNSIGGYSAAPPSKGPTKEPFPKEDMHGNEAIAMDNLAPGTGELAGQAVKVLPDEVSAKTINEQNKRFWERNW